MDTQRFRATVVGTGRGGGQLVEVPAEPAAALALDASARAAWDGLSFTARKEHARGIAEAKRPETRAKRLAATLAMLAGRR